MLPEKKFRGSIQLLLCPSVCPSELISLKPLIRNLLLIKNVPLDKDLWTKVSQGNIGKFKVTQSF
jgi:hypothetical protein